MEFLQSHLTASLVTPTTVGNFLTSHDFGSEWSAPSSLAQSVFPKFLKRIGRHAFRIHGTTPGRGMLQHKGQWFEPNNDMRALAMGFPRDRLTNVPISEAVRHRLLGSCIDGNILALLVDALCTTSTTPSAWLLASSSPPAPWAVYLDSSSSSHMWGDLSEFSTYTPHTNGPVWVGGIEPILYGSGTVQMRLKTTRPEYVTSTLKNVLYVSDLAKQSCDPMRLFSASFVADQCGAEVTIGANTRISLKNGLVIPSRRSGKHFFIDAIP